MRDLDPAFPSSAIDLQQARSTSGLRMFRRWWFRPQVQPQRGAIRIGAILEHGDGERRLFTMYCGMAVSKRPDDVMCLSRDWIAPRWGLTDVLWRDGTQGCAECQGVTLTLGAALGYRMTPFWGYARVAATSLA